MSLPSIAGFFRSCKQLWSNRGAFPDLFSMARCDRLNSSSIRAARRLMARGHALSAEKGLPVESSGEPVAWYTYPLLDYLDFLDVKNWIILEFGSGQSTLYWAARSKKVISFESCRDWFAKMKKSIPPNVDLVFTPSTEEVALQLAKLNQPPDLVVIDGMERRTCAGKAIEFFGLEPLYILDNSDWFLKAGSVLRQAGMIEVKFSGFGPVNNYAWCSSLWLSDRNLHHLKRSEMIQHIVPGGLPPGDTEDRQDVSSVNTVK